MSPSLPGFAVLNSGRSQPGEKPETECERAKPCSFGASNGSRRQTTFSTERMGFCPVQELRSKTETTVMLRHSQRVNPASGRMTLSTAGSLRTATKVKTWEDDSPLRAQQVNVKEWATGSVPVASAKETSRLHTWQ